MRGFTVGLIALAAGAAILVLAGSAVAATQSASNTTSLSMRCEVPLACFELYEDGHWVPVDLPTASTSCGMPLVLLISVPIGTVIACPTGKKLRRVECAVGSQPAAGSLAGRGGGGYKPQSTDLVPAGA